jgi:ribosome-binding factor A
MAGLKSATGYVRSELGHRIRLRRTPEVVFQEDRSIERGTRVLSLINQLSRDRPLDKQVEEDEDSIEDEYDAEISAEEEAK